MERTTVMANNFKISVHRKDNCLHLKLNGHFDGSSAYQLIHLLQAICRGMNKVLIHTDQIKHIYPFGRSTFLNNIHLLAGKAACIIFTGRNARQMLPEFAGDYAGIDLSTM
jgi:hypothetical protein